MAGDAGWIGPRFQGAQVHLAMPAPRTPLSGRYRCVETYPLPDGACWWIAIDGDSGQHVAAAVVTPRDLPRWEAVRGEKHAHLAGITDVVTQPDPAAVPGGSLPGGAGVAVAELVPGQTLHGQLARGRVHPFKAVAWLLRLVDAVQQLHRRGAPHGAISPFTIVVEPAGRAIAPVLATLVAPPIAAYASPERLSGAGPSSDDDVWALHAVLYTALTGRVPYEGGAQSLLKRVKAGRPKSLADHGVSEPNLQRILERGLDPDERRRVTELDSLAAALDAWERGREPEPLRPKPPRVQRASHAAVVETIAFDVSSLTAVDAVPAPPALAPPDAEAVPPAPAPAALAPAPAALAPPPAGPTSPQDPFVAPPPPAPPIAAPVPPPIRPAAAPRRAALWLSLLGGVVALGALGAGSAFWLLRRPAPVTPERPPAAAPSRVVVSAAPPASPQLTPGEQRASCIRSYFEPPALQGVTELDFLCGGEPFPEVSTRLFRLAAPTPSAVASAVRPSEPGKEAGILITGTATPYDLGWYEIPAAVIVRATCCPGAAPVALPTTPGWCEQLQGQMSVLAEASRKPIDLSPYGRKFGDAVQCLYSTATRHGYRYQAPPSDLQRYNFQRFLKHAAESDTQRSRMPWLR